MSDDEKKTYSEKAVKDRARYEKQKAEFDKTGKFTPVSEKNTQGSDKE